MAHQDAGITQGKAPKDLAKQQEEKTHSLILLSLADDVLYEVSQETTAAALWMKLEKLYMTKSLSRKLMLKKRIFIQQFELLLKACLPDGISYLTFKDSTAHANFSTLAMCDYFKESQRIAKELKSSFANDPEMMAELRRIEQVAERNNIALNVICRLGAPDPRVKISFTLCHHPSFATAIVKRS